MAVRQTQLDPITPAAIRMSGVSYAWPGRNAFALSIDDFSLARGERILLLGPSGSGKSTLLSLLCGIVSPDNGAISLLGTNIAGLSNAARDRFRAEHIGVVFQMFNLLPYGTVIDNVVLPLAFAPMRLKRAENAGGGQHEARRILAALEIDEKLLAGPAASLSVGQQQRVAVARALIGSPEVIIADEPTSALDRSRQRRFLDLLFAQVAANDTALVMVSHDESLSAQFDCARQLDEIVTVKELV